MLTNLESKSTSEQVIDFENASGNHNYLLSLANSAAILAWESTHNDYTRPGIMLYGSSPFKDTLHQKKLAPVMTLSSSLISIKSFKAGQINWLWRALYLQERYTNRRCGYWVCRWLSPKR